ncbi:NAD-dependent epimerase/dehydratase family protein [Nioella nitratireducens]|uniref:NAD-dependent epimerase/dehydratase family protein n=1 Tax=Nioella nitratireducens TaxID=1287720 RepID=UPI0008FD617A|nr:NAD(P)-dependent oxidoreductase [Nioella nitratireducens]
MGTLTRICITGAGSAVGRAAAEAAMQAGFEVVLHSRYGHKQSWPDVPEVLPVACPLDAPEMAGLLAGCVAVIHVAGRMVGTEEQFQKDVVADSAALMQAAAEAGLTRVVLAGSVAVYRAGQPGGNVDEESPVEDRPDLRDAYTRAKLAQEAVISEAADAARIGLSILRLGAIWGPGRLWNAHLGVRKGPLLIRMARDGQIPLCDINRAGEALIAALRGRPGVYNVLDDDLPDRVRFLNALGGAGPRLVLPVGWRLMDRLAGMRPDRPGLLRRPTLRARMMPTGWSAAKAREALTLRPQLSFEQLMGLARQHRGWP